MIPQVMVMASAGSFHGFDFSLQIYYIFYYYIMFISIRMFTTDIILSIFFVDSAKPLRRELNKAINALIM